MSTPEEPYGPSPHGRCWGNRPWREAAQLPGSRQTGLGGAFIRRFRWWEWEPHPEWVGAQQGETDTYARRAAGVPGKLRVIYIPHCWDPPTVPALEDGVAYEAYYFDPCTGADVPLGPVTPDDESCWKPPFPPEVHDWLLVLEAR